MNASEGDVSGVDEELHLPLLVFIRFVIHAEEEDSSTKNQNRRPAGDAGKWPRSA